MCTAVVRADPLLMRVTGRHAHCSTTCLAICLKLFWHQHQNLLYLFVSPGRDHVFIAMDRSFFFIPVYLYSSVYRLIINTPTHRYAGCSRGCPLLHSNKGSTQPLYQEAFIIKSWQICRWRYACVHQQSVKRLLPLRCTYKISFLSNDINATIASRNHA